MSNHRQTIAKSSLQNARDRLHGGPLPLYYQIAGMIRNRILAGVWSPGSQLPTEDEWAREYGVSRPTIRNAKALLEKEGYLRSIKGSGSYVNGSDTWEHQPPTVDNLSDIFHFGSQMSFRIHQLGMVSNSPEVWKHLNNPSDRYVFQIRGTRWFQSRVISFATYYLPFRFGSRIPLDSLDDNPFIPQLEKMAGIRVIEGVQNISLGQAGAEAARHLGLEKGNPVLVVQTVYFDETHVPIEYVETCYRQELPYAIRVKRS